MPYLEIAEQIEKATSKIMGKEELVKILDEYIWVPSRDYSYGYITVEHAPEPKRIEIDIIKQLIVDNNYDHFYMQNLIEAAFNEIRER